MSHFEHPLKLSIGYVIPNKRMFNWDIYQPLWNIHSERDPLNIFRKIYNPNADTTLLFFAGWDYNSFRMTHLKEHNFNWKHRSWQNNFFPFWGCKILLILNLLLFIPLPAGNCPSRWPCKGAFLDMDEFVWFITPWTYLWKWQVSKHTVGKFFVSRSCHGPAGRWAWSFPNSFLPCVLKTIWIGLAWDFSNQRPGAPSNAILGVPWRDTLHRETWELAKQNYWWR